MQPMVELLRDILRYRQLLWRLVGRDLRVRYKRSVLGIAWAFAEPLVMMGLFTLVFSRFLRINTHNYPAFVLCGIIVWSFFQTGVVYSLSAVTANAGLVKKIYFPREILPLATVLGRFVHFGLSMLLLAPFLLWFEAPISWALLYLPLLALTQLALVGGASLLFASLATLYEDVAFLVNFSLTGLFYVSPVFYPVDVIPAALRPWYMLNPMAALITAYRAVLLDGRAPNFAELGPTLALSLLLLVAGAVVFHRLQWLFAEVL
jgi:lipopolysaccharide transport system permease protein